MPPSSSLESLRWRLESAWHFLPSPPPPLCGEGERKREESLFRLAGDGRGRDAKESARSIPLPHPLWKQERQHKKAGTLGRRRGGERGREKGGAPPNYVHVLLFLAHSSVSLRRERREGGTVALSLPGRRQVRYGPPRTVAVLHCGTTYVHAPHFMGVLAGRLFPLAEYTAEIIYPVL